ncbi:MAG: hypothetical protein R6U96_09700 [Promethearchaeia archaeon]
MTILFIPVADLSKSKSRLTECFTPEQRQDFTRALFKDLAEKVTSLDAFRAKVVYSPDERILKLAEIYDLIALKEERSQNSKNFDAIFMEMDEIAINRFNAGASLVVFLDLPLITQENLLALNSILKKNQVVISPALNSAGISVLGRRPVDIISSQFDDPSDPSLVAHYKTANQQEVDRFVLYDSLRASFDVDIKDDLILTFEYLKVFNLTDSYTFRFLEHNLDQKICKNENLNNREFLYKQKQ